jgi:hypothetical protein
LKPRTSPMVVSRVQLSGAFGEVRPLATPVSERSEDLDSFVWLAEQTHPGLRGVQTLVGTAREPMTAVNSIGANEPNLCVTPRRRLHRAAVLRREKYSSKRTHGSPQAAPKTEFCTRVRRRTNPNASGTTSRVRESVSDYVAVPVTRIATSRVRSAAETRIAVGRVTWRASASVADPELRWHCALGLSGSSGVA